MTQRPTTLYQILVRNALLFVLLFATQGFLSCKKKDEPDPPAQPQDETEASYAGEYSDDFDYFAYSPAFEVDISWDTQHLYGTGSDSIDLDLDGSFDLFLTISVLDEDSLHLLSGMPNPFPYCSVNTSSAFTCAFYTSVFYIGLGQTSSVSFVDRLDLSERIDTLSDWRNEGKMWQENPGDVGAPPFGDWSAVDDIHYMAIKKGTDRFGWVEIDASNREAFKILRCAIRH